jgi:hypothetical protein
MLLKKSTRTLANNNAIEVTDFGAGSKVQIEYKSDCSDCQNSWNI